MRLTSDKCTYSFWKGHEPVCKVTAPAKVTLETLDCYANQLRDGQGNKDHVNWDNVNPTTGPVYVEGAEVGDTLKVTIESIDVADFGVVSHGEAIELVDVKDGYADFLGTFKIPLNKMVGVIGVAPAGEAINNGTPGRHGGNMDTKLIGEGAVLYLPVAVEGGLFAVGDVHAVMGDGEVGGTGLEIPAEVTVTLEVIKGGAPDFPLLETEDAYAFLVSDETIDQAIDIACQLMHGFLKERMPNLSDEEVHMLMSLVGQVEVCQIVDPLKTARIVFPKKYVIM